MRIPVAAVVLMSLLAGCSDSPVGATVWVTNEEGGDLSVVDVARAREIARIPLGKRPRGLAVSPDH